MAELTDGGCGALQVDGAGPAFNESGRIADWSGGSGTRWLRDYSPSELAGAFGGCTAVDATFVDGLVRSGQLWKTPNGNLFGALVAGGQIGIVELGDPPRVLDTIAVQDRFVSLSGSLPASFAGARAGTARQRFAFASDFSADLAGNHVGHGRSVLLPFRTRSRLVEGMIEFFGFAGERATAALERIEGGMPAAMLATPPGGSSTYPSTIASLICRARAVNLYLVARDRGCRVVDRTLCCGRPHGRKLGDVPRTPAEPSCISWPRPSARTLFDWERRWEADRLAAKPRGRPPAGVSPSEAKAITALLHLLGPFEGLPVLRRSMPDVPRAELEERLRAYREEYWARHHVDILALRWRWVGAVWAMDFAAPLNPVDGVYPHVLSVRDLGSGNALVWLPVRQRTAEVVRDALRALFAAW